MSVYKNVFLYGKDLSQNIFNFAKIALLLSVEVLIRKRILQWWDKWKKISSAASLIRLSYPQLIIVRMFFWWVVKI